MSEAHRPHNTMFFASPIDIPTWDVAKWKGVAYLSDPSGQMLPGIALLFTDAEAGKTIFKAWRDALGPKDQDEYLRVSIIEGDIPGLDPGYSVHIGASPENIMKRAKEQGQEPEGEIRLTMVSRFTRMSPAPNSPFLPRFKQEFPKHGRYFLVPAGLVGDKLEPYLDLSIEKTQIHFRNVSEVGESDIDRVVFQEA